MTGVGCSWGLRPSKLSIRSEEVHVWRASLNLPRSQVQTLESNLVPEEIGRALRFCSANDRRHFIVARGVLRSILGFYLDVEPRQIEFCYGASGKPAIGAPVCSDTLSFNLSHSAGLAVYAVTRKRQIGIDVERVRPLPECDEIATRFFSPGEAKVIRAVPSELKNETFFRCWTRKEAYIKATGEGLSLPLHLFHVSLSTAGRTALVTAPDPSERYRWSLQEFEPAPGYISALVVEGYDWHPKCWEWSA